MKNQYRVAIIGGGVVGASVAYHLAKFGWTDVAILERDVLTAELKPIADFCQRAVANRYPFAAGSRADVLVEPTSSREDVERALEYLPTGGRTPLAHGLELAAGYVTDQAVVIVITDGRANWRTRCAERTRV